MGFAALYSSYAIYFGPTFSHSQRATASGDDDASLPDARRFASRIAAMSILPSSGRSAALRASSSRRFGDSRTMAS